MLLMLSLLVATITVSRFLTPAAAKAVCSNRNQ
jgi:hypothetical protein